jgi:S1-C subfamily serine protease
MSTALRTWMAGFALALSALILLANANTEHLGGEASACLIVLFAYGWVLSIGERTRVQPDQQAAPRFPLVSRLLSVGSPLTSLCLVPVLFLGVVTRSTVVLLLGVGLVFAMTVDELRRFRGVLLPLLLSLPLALYAMDGSAWLPDVLMADSGWVSGPLALALLAAVVAASLLRPAIAAAGPRDQLIGFSASLVGYAAALFALGVMAGSPPSFLALSGVLLAGSVLQSIVLRLLRVSRDIDRRPDPGDSRVNAGGIGMALLPLLLPALWLLHGQPRDALLLLIIPAVPAVGLVASALDRLDGRPFRGSRLAALLALGLWFLAGPLVLRMLYARGGPLSTLAANFHAADSWEPVVATGDGVSASGIALGGQLRLLGGRAADRCREITLMVGLIGLLSAAYLRHAAPGMKGVRRIRPLCSLGLACLSLLLFAADLGSPLAIAVSCLLMFLLDHRAGPWPAEETAARESETFHLSRAFLRRIGRIIQGQPRLAMGLTGIASLAVASLAAVPSPGVSDPRQALVRVRVEVGGGDFVEPLEPGEIPWSKGSGVIIDDERILTSAHGFRHAVRVEVRREGTQGWADARVEFIDDSSDLVMLSVDEPGFFDGVHPVLLGSLPAVQEPLRVLGYPGGADSLRIVDGVFMGVGLEAYSLTGWSLLVAKSDVQLIKGMSGGPALHEGRLVGLAMQSPLDDDASHRSEFVPMPVIAHFLEDIEDGRVDGCHGLGTPFQPLTNITARRELGIPDGMQGVQLTGLRKDFFYSAFHPGDFIFELDGHPIPDDGLVSVGAHQVGFEYLVQKLQADKLVDARVIRNGEPKTLRIRTYSSYLPPGW